MECFVRYQQETKAECRLGVRRRCITRCASVPCVRWGLLALLLALGHFASAQNESMSPSMSNTQAPTTTPSGASNMTMPSAGPIVIQPTTMPSVMPSLIPSTDPSTLAPSVTSMPTASAAPTATVLTAETFNNRMIFDGLPIILNMADVQMTNMTGNQTWANITSEHVINYWRARNFTDFNITSVQTNVIDQFFEPIPEPIVNSTPTDENVTWTRMIYDQQIRYTSTGEDTPVLPGNDSILCVSPFRFDAQTYSDNLWKAFGTENRIQMLEMALSRPLSPEPTMAPGVPTPNSPEHMETGQIVGISLGSLIAVGLISFAIVWYTTRRKPDIVLDEEFVEDGSENDIVMVPPPSEDPRVCVPQNAQSGDAAAGNAQPANAEQPSDKSYPETSESEDYMIDHDEDPRLTREDSL